jgi:hypothetical protein
LYRYNPVPQKPEVGAMYAEAEKRLRVLSARHDESLNDAGALSSKLDEAGSFPAPGDKAKCLLEMLHDPARRVVRHAPPEAGSRAAAAMAAAAAFVAPHCAAATTFLQHAAATRAATEALHAKEAEEARLQLVASTAEAEAQLYGGATLAPGEEEEGEGAEAEGDDPAPPAAAEGTEPSKDSPEGGGDGDAAPAEAAPDPTMPPLALEPEALAAFEASSLELPIHLHTALLKQAFNYESWDTFNALHALAKLRLGEIAAAATDHQHETGAVFEPQATALGVTLDVLAAVRAVQTEGEGGGAGKDGGAAAEEEEEEGPDALHALGETLTTLPPQASHACADIVTDAALLLWSLVKGVFTDATRDGAPPEEEALVVDLLSGIHAAFQLVGLEDGALRATLALRLSLMLERRGDARRGAVVAHEAAAAADSFRNAAVDRSRGADDEPTRYITAESVWGSAAASSGDTADTAAGGAFSFTPTTLSESDQAYACLHADLLAVHFRLQLAVGLLDQREEADRRLARVVNKVQKREDQAEIFGVKSAWWGSARWNQVDP